MSECKLRISFKSSVKKYIYINITWLPVAPSIDDVLMPVFAPAKLPWWCLSLPFTSETVLVLRLEMTDAACVTPILPTMVDKDNTHVRR